MNQAVSKKQASTPCGGGHSKTPITLRELAAIDNFLTRCALGDLSPHANRGLVTNVVASQVVSLPMLLLHSSAREVRSSLSMVATKGHSHG